MLRISLAVLLSVITLASAGDQIDVNGKVAVVTGASRGIGAASAKVLAAAGIKVVLAARSIGKLNEVKAEIEAAGGTAAAIKCDVTQAAEIKNVFELTEQLYGGVDFVFANAGWEGTGKDLTETEDDELQKVIDINIMGYLFTMKYAVRALKARGGGAMIFTSSVAAIVPNHMMQAAPLIKTVVPYGITKGANDYTARAGAAFTDHNIRSYGILPGAFDTTMLRNIAVNTNQELASFSGFNPYYADSIGNAVHIGRAALAMFDNSTSYVTGQTVVCDNDVTIPADLFYRNLARIIEPGHGPYQFKLDEDTLRDYKGDKYVKKDEL